MQLGKNLGIQNVVDIEEDSVTTPETATETVEVTASANVSATASV